jgi:hypothetical protein
MLFRIATSPRRLGWAPATFWKATAAELDMAMEGLTENFKAAPFISREEVRRIAAQHGKRRSLREDPRHKVIGGGQTASRTSNPVQETVVRQPRDDV